MQKTAKKTAPVPMPQYGTVSSNVVNPLRQAAALQSYDATFSQWSGVGNTYQPTITWQDTTSNATYSSASSVLNVT